MSKLQENLTQCQKDRELLVCTLNDLLQHIGVLKDERFISPHRLAEEVKQYIEHKYPWWIVLYRDKEWTSEKLVVSVLHTESEARKTYDSLVPDTREVWLLNAKCVSKSGPPDPGGIFNHGGHTYDKGVEDHDSDDDEGTVHGQHGTGKTDGG